MSENTTGTSDAADEPVDPGTPADDDQSVHSGPTEPDADDTGRGNPEAAKWRKQFRASEAEKTALLRASEAEKTALHVEKTVLQARVDEMLRREIQRVAAETLADGEDVWREPLEITELLDDFGLVDHDKVRGHAGHLLITHPHWAKRGPLTPPASTVTSDKTPFDSPGGANWSEALRGGTGG